MHDYRSSALVLSLGQFVDELFQLLNPLCQVANLVIFRLIDSVELLDRGQRYSTFVDQVDMLIVFSEPECGAEILSHRPHMSQSSPVTVVVPGLDRHSRQPLENGAAIYRGKIRLEVAVAGSNSAAGATLYLQGAIHHDFPAAGLVCEDQITGSFSIGTGG